TIRILTGLLHDFGGNVNVNGFSMPRHKEKIYRFLGYLPQNPAFQEWRTVHGTLQLLGKLSGLQGNGLENRIDEVLELLLLTNDKYKIIKELSGGMKQKLGLAQAILHEPEFLILDEPFVGMDPSARHQVKQIIRSLNDKNVTVFLSSHILADVEDLAKQTAFLNSGKLMFKGTVPEAKKFLDLANEVEILLSLNTGQWKELKHIPGIDTVDCPKENTLRISFTKHADTDAAIHEAVQLLLRDGSRIRSIYPAFSGLEELFARFMERGG
ncbi:MAG: ABC transporter ATP-binding protein, partial [bacterium]|nr:ABC transporter ATP-binding protein [bacterium]